jgi:hypothetical protein
MRKFLPLIALSLLPGTGFAESFHPPLPEVQSATAEFSYALASLGFIAVLACAQALVRRR